MPIRMDELSPKASRMLVSVSAGLGVDGVSKWFVPGIDTNQRRCSPSPTLVILIDCPYVPAQYRSSMSAAIS